ncbi:hypothetical protein [Neptuniibacter sp. QD37_11]|uniref:hypothetical protein n=1 Tax=Neptuniibacter sp. QD37_11 TaxID=3398209 RepID=UPI0039F5EF14
MPKKTIIHVNQHVIKRNRKTGSVEPVLTCKDYKENRYAHEAILLDEHGEPTAKVVYRPDNPLPCGAHVWIETMNEVIVHVFDSNTPVQDIAQQNNNTPRVE